MNGAELLAAWIERQRAGAGYLRFTVTGFAKALEVSRDAVNCWLRGAKTPNPENALAIARVTKNAVPATSWRVEEA